MKISILNQIEMCTNPLVLKHFKHNLLNLKQKHPHVFQDLCLYSDVCRMLSENSYRLMARRFIQDIFFDVNFEPLSKDLNLIFSSDRTPFSPFTPMTKSTGVDKAKTWQQRASEERQNEIFSADVDISATKKPGVLSVVVGFEVPMNSELSNNDMISPTRHYQASSPPLTSVQEENVVSSSENILDSIAATTLTASSTMNKFDKEQKQNSITQKTDDANKPLVNNTILTLDQLKLTYNENKFPIKRDDKSNIVK